MIRQCNKEIQVQTKLVRLVPCVSKVRISCYLCRRVGDRSVEIDAVAAGGRAAVRRMMDAIIAAQVGAGAVAHVVRDLLITALESLHV